MAPSLNSSEPARPASKSPHPQRSVVLLAIFALIIGVMGARWLLGYPLITTRNFNGVILETPKPAQDFTLIASSGEPTSLSDFQGKVTLLYFGYTFCPDVCPTSLSKLATVVQALAPARREEVQVVMVTVDPQRDTAEKLDDYVTHFDPTFLGLSGSEAEIAAAAKPFEVYYEKQPGTAATGYLIDHTASVAVVDKQGVWRLIFPYDMRSDHMVADLNRLLRE